MWSFLYFGLLRLAQLIVSRFRSRESNEIEILALRHQLAILGANGRVLGVEDLDVVMILGPIVTYEDQRSCAPSSGCCGRLEPERKLPAT
jgi:hypothetical protein